MTMSWYTLSRKIQILPQVLKNTCVAGSQIRLVKSLSVIPLFRAGYFSVAIYQLLVTFLSRNTLRAGGPVGYDYRGRCGYSSWPITRRSQLSSYTTNNVRRYCPSFESRRHYTTSIIQEKKSRKMLIYLTALVFGMVGCSYAAVPLYRRFCQATGYGGTVQRREVRSALVIVCGVTK